jgi:excisionase family DNA binding protein
MARPKNPLTDMRACSSAFVTVRELSEYWKVSRKHVLKLIETGRLEAIRLGPKTYRVRVQTVMEFERRNRGRGL